MNTVSFTGRLTTDPGHEAYAGAESVTAVTTMRVAIPRRNDGADFVTVIGFNGLGVTCADHLNKGRLIAVEGRLRSSEWTTSEGSKRSKLEVVANNVDFLDRPKTALATAPQDGEEPF